MAGTGPLNSENIARLIEDLDEALHEAGGQAELYLAGGARMLFGWRTDRHTSDIDGVMRTGQNVLMATAIRISKRHGLEPTWVNPAVTYFVPTKPDPGEVTLYSGKALTVKGASIEHMLAMKIRGHRNIDLDDAEVLIQRLKLTDTQAIQRIAEDAYEGHRGENRTMIQEGLKRIAETMPNLTINHFAGERRQPVEPPTVLPPGHKLQPPERTHAEGGGKTPADARSMPERPSAADWPHDIAEAQKKKKRLEKPSAYDPGDNKPGGRNR